ncbi:MAG: peptidylprolyl isomerase [Oscillospiraceae bacterium]|nr:peptidylprolyl isomerase [Oscillospiraceae bacterium]MBR7009555.1 peptidylprolyl isomerase [Oscillospiraceae bacterium]
MKQNKTLVLIIGILLAAVLVVALILGIRALVKPSGTPTAAETAAGTGAPAGSTEAAQGGEVPASGETAEPASSSAPEETMEETPEMAAARTKDAYTLDELGADDPRLDLTVGVSGDAELSNRQLQVYYCMQFFSFMNQYGGYASMLGLDETKPLRDQPSTVGKLTWEQYFLMTGIEQFRQYSAVAAKARAEGYTMTEEEQEQLQKAISGMEEDAKAQGMETEAYLQSFFGPTVRMQDYEQYMQTYFLAMSYENNLYENLNLTDAELEKYFDEHPDEFTGIDKTLRNVNVRHVLFLSDADGNNEVTDEEKAAAKEKAEALLAEFRKAPSEEAFAALAKEQSEDPGSKEEGGLYEDVYPGQMVQSFNDWCFDAARQPGDTDVVETEYGFHVMYFVAQTDEYYWKSRAEENCAVERMQKLIDEIVSAQSLELRYEDVVLAPIPIPEAEE